MAVKLQQGQSALVHGRKDILRRRIGKNADANDEGRQAAFDGLRHFHGDAARTARMEHQTQRIGPGLDRRLRVPDARNPADFDLHVHRSIKRKPPAFGNSDTSRSSVRRTARGAAPSRLPDNDPRAPSDDETAMTSAGPHRSPRRCGARRG